MYTGSVCTFVSLYSSLYNLDTLGEFWHKVAQAVSKFALNWDLYVPLMRVLIILGLSGCPERLGRVFPVIPVVAGLLQDYEADASFSFSLPRVILREKVKAHPAFAGLLFSYVPLPYESELSTVERHTKKAQPHGCAFTFFRDPDRIRTCDPQLRRLLLYPAELPDHSLKKWVQI